MQLGGGNFMVDLDHLRADEAGSRLWIEVADLLRGCLPYVEETIIGAGHLLQIQLPEPVARAVADFLTRDPMIGG